MTPIERSIAEGQDAAQQRRWYAEAAWEREARASLKASAESARRSIGQRIRYIAARLAARRGEAK